MMGAAGLNMLVCYRIDTYHQKIRQLESAIEDRDVRLKKLEESAGSKKVILKDIKVFLNFEEDDIDRITIEKFIRDKYKGLLGKEVKDIDMEIIEQVVDRRIFKIQDREFRLVVRKVMLTEILQVWIDVNK